MIAPPPKKRGSRYFGKGAKKIQQTDSKETCKTAGSAEEEVVQDLQTAPNASNNILASALVNNIHDRYVCKFGFYCYSIAI